MTITDLALNVRKHLLTVSGGQLHAELAQRKQGQRETFEALKAELPRQYAAMKPYDISRYVSPIWKEFNAKVEAALLPSPPFSFLRHPTIMFTMFVTAGGQWLQDEICFLEQRFSPEQLGALLAEDYAGMPLLMNARYRTSHNTIHHAYHLARYQEARSKSFDSMKTVVEWGGGYGNLAKIFYRFSPKSHTYIIMDTPLFSCLQWLYLSTVLGQDRTHLIGEPDAAIREGAINLLPVSFLENQKISADLFISTWALNESSAASQRAVMEKQWFGAQNLLLAYREHDTRLPDFEPMVKTGVSRGGTIGEIPFLPGNRYLFL
ncbi:MAG: hypothetical protein HY594_05515 [Candidatus Omnitrophica bacterium]|nr:hypothetical protein [Candidatus Omnitrophota bacterium]